MGTGSGKWVARRMLVVDDEPDIVRMLSMYFSGRGYEVLEATSAPAAIECVEAAVWVDIVLLDVSMPGTDGLALCRLLRERLSCPIIFLTARIEDADQIDGFAAGADDYVTKPFSLAVLESRVRAHLARERRKTSRAAVRFEGNVVIDYAERTVTIAGNPCELTRTEYDIVALLSKNAGRVYDRARIYEEVWGWDAAGDPSIVTEHVRRARGKLAAAGAQGDVIATVWGVGYKWAL